MVISNSTFLPFSLTDEERFQFVQVYAANTDIKDDDAVRVRALWATRCMQLTNNNYLFTQKSKDIIDKLMVVDCYQIRKDLIHFCDNSGTLLLNEFSFIQYYKEDEKTVKFSLIGLNKRRRDEFYNPSYLINIDDIGEQAKFDPVVDNFFRMILFSKCANVYRTTLKRKSFQFEPKELINGQKFVNKSDHDIIIIHPDSKFLTDINTTPVRKLMAVFNQRINEAGTREIIYEFINTPVNGNSTIEQNFNSH